MHLQQTKRGSRGTGGPQYYFHDLTAPVKTFLRAQGAVNVALVTPYGATKSDYFAVSKDHKLDAQHKPVSGSVGHDRIQQGRARESIGEAIRFWFNLPAGDFEYLGIDIDVIEDVFYLTPLTYKLVSARREKEIVRVERPLTFSRDYVSPFWVQQLGQVHRRYPGIVEWSLNEICRIVADHRPRTKMPGIDEIDILRASGPLRHFGVALGGYARRGYDCITEFAFLNYPPYSVPVEIKKFSRDFKYQQSKYGKELLSRAVVLCAFHDHKHLPRNIDVIELEAMCEQLPRFAS